MFTDAPPRVEVPNAKYTEFLAKADNTDPFKILAHQLDLQTSKSTTIKPGFITVYNIQDFSVFGMTQVLGLHGETVKTYEYPAFIALTDAQLAANVTTGFPGATYVDEDTEQTISRTWAEWATNYGRTVQALTGDLNGIELSNGHKHYGSDEFIILYAASITPLDKPTYNAMILQAE